MRQLLGLSPEQLQTLTRVSQKAKGSQAIRLHELLQRSTLSHLLDWGQHYFPRYFTLPPSQMHLQLIRSLQWRHETRAINEAVIAPRGGAKTTWVSKVYPLFCVCHGLEPYILLVSDSSSQAEENLEAIRHELEENDRLRADYPLACTKGERWTQDVIITGNGIKLHAVGTRKKVRGRAHRSERPSLIIVDDLENDDDVQSETQRDRVWRWFRRALLPAGTPKTNVLFVGTALHPDDCLQKIKLGKDVVGWRMSSFSALVREPDRQDLWDKWRLLFKDMSSTSEQREVAARMFYQEHREEMERGAELLWPEREPLYDLMVLRETLGETAFQAEKQGNAAAAGATEFGSDLFSGDIWFSSWPDMTLKAMALDPSKGQSEKNDYSAIVWGGLGTDGNIYVDADLERRDASKVVADGIQRYREFLPHAFGLETVMFLQLFANLFEMEARRLGILLPITQINPHENKVVRIRQLTPYLTGRRFRFRAGSRGAEMLVDQLKQFPTGKHDDGPDALQMMIELLRHMSTAGDSNYDSEQWTP